MSKRLSASCVRWLSILVVFCLSLTLPTLSSAGGGALTFLAIGDIPYGEAQMKVLKETILPAIQGHPSPFLIHYGDFRGSSESCSNELFMERLNQIKAMYSGPIFYSPGDNDWTDCDRPNVSDPKSELERLDFLRRHFFGTRLDLAKEWDYDLQSQFPENAVWRSGGVVFGTVHIVGTNNGRQEIRNDDVELALALVEARDQANREWLNVIFGKASTRGKEADAIVIATQANLTTMGGIEPCSASNRINCDAFAKFRADLIRHAVEFNKPVMLLHGDTSTYCFDYGFGGKSAPNLIRLDGAGDYTPLDATEITFDPKNEKPFTARTLVGKESPGICR